MMCKPFLRFQYKIHARYFVLPILIFAPLYSVPRFFEIRSFTNATYICTSNSSYWFQDPNEPLDNVNNKSLESTER
jgi:hypothetical protein